MKLGYKALLCTILGLSIGYLGLTSCDTKNNSQIGNKYKALDEIIMRAIPDSARLQDPEHTNFKLSTHMRINFTEQDKEKIASKKFPTLTKLVDLFSKNINYHENEKTSIETMIDNLKQNYEIEGVKIDKENELNIIYSYWDKEKNKKTFRLVLLDDFMVPLEKVIKEIREMRKNN